jgi:hypothetical protein
MLPRASLTFAALLVLAMLRPGTPCLGQDSPGKAPPKTEKPSPETEKPSPEEVEPPPDTKKPSDPEKSAGETDQPEAEPPPESAEADEHPLLSAVEFAKGRHEYLQKNIRDFTCILVKRERIAGRLRGYEYIETRVRLEQKRDDRIVVPFSVYMRFLAPAAYRGRKVLYVRGQNEGKMLVRNGGKRFSYITVRLEPDSEAAMKESRYPVTETGLKNVTRRLLEKAEEDMRHDPTGANTRVTFFRDAKVDGRSCTRIRVMHPEPDEKLSFHIANVFVDDELGVPIRVEGYGWPDVEDDAPPLLEEYTFTRLRLNVGLADAHFDPSIISN